MKEEREGEIQKRTVNCCLLGFRRRNSTGEKRRGEKEGEILDEEGSLGNRPLEKRREEERRREKF